MDLSNTALHLWLLENIKDHNSFNTQAKPLPYKPMSVSEMRQRLKEGLDIDACGSYNFLTKAQ